ncbi:MAG: hypothetical protein HYS12_18660 [Planctomycetes bacterium]|nr:hypothetical protein [Planctomycetota bacterium]
MRHHPSTRSPARRRGAVLGWLVICLGVIVIIVALGTDGGRMMEERRRVQAAADVAALAAAADLYQHYSDNQGHDPNGTAAAAALSAAADNGCPNDGTHSVVTVNIPPQSGIFAGKAEYVEVLVTSQLSGTFSAAFTSDRLPVKARAVAVGRPKALGLMVLSPSAAGAFSNSSKGNVTVLNAPIIVNSSDAAAYDLSGTSTTQAAYHQVVGGVHNQGATLIGPVQTGADPSADPLRTLPAPNAADYPLQSDTPLSIGSGSDVVLQPGVYHGGISIGGTAKVTLAPGVYILDGGGFTFIGNGSLTANRAMLFNTGGSSSAPVKITGSGTVTLTPPTDGPYQGLSIFQDRTLSQTVHLAGNGNYQISGAVYAPGAAVSLSGNGTSGTNSLGGGYICNTLQVSGSSSFSVSMAANRPRVPEVRLVE